MPENYILLERTELNASAASVTFANIPQTGYTDLKVVVSARDTSSSDAKGSYYTIAFNGGSSYAGRYLQGNGSSAISGVLAQLAGISTTSTSTSNTFCNDEIYIPNYTSTSAKSYSVDTVTENNATGAYATLVAGSWSGAAVTTITFTPSVGSFVQYSTFSLYGIAAVGTTPAIAPKASGGNVIDFDGTYWIHTFLTSGTFTPQVGLTCDVLVVAGGGGGGGGAGNLGGGGGAGGLLYYGSESPKSPNGSAQTLLTGTNYLVTVGAGGSGSNSTGGTTGSDSVFSSFTANGGGGGYGASAAAKNGGSGGGTFSTSGAGTGISGQGFAGGTGYGAGADYGAGGGGGAGGLGVSAAVSVAPQGGVGLAYSITGSSVEYGGGGGGASEAGVPLANARFGGGAGGRAPSTSATSATINRGGGGGGSYISAGAGNGSSGIVIIRYPAA
jgi:hypothetical protein